MRIDEFELLFAEKIREVASADDPAHDFAHFERVVSTAKRLAEREQAKLEVVIPAAWLHDLVIVRKDDPRRRQASKLSAQAAVEFLREVHYPEIHHAAIAHAIEAHSYSANIETFNLEAMIVQDADRLDALGAIGVARCFATAGILKRPFYSSKDPFCERREPDDSKYTVDHFYAKLFKIAETLKTDAGRWEGANRVRFMQAFIKELGLEVQSARTVVSESSL